MALMLGNGSIRIGTGLAKSTKKAVVPADGLLFRKRPMRPGGNISQRGKPFRQQYHSAIARPEDIAQTDDAENVSQPRETTDVDNRQPSAIYVSWKCCIRSSEPLIRNETSARLSLAVCDTQSGRWSDAFDVDSWQPPKEVTKSDGTVGWEREGAIVLPSDIKTPGAMRLRKLAGSNGAKSKDYIGSIELICASSVHTINANSWVSSDHDWRIFFSGNAYLPKDTPPALLGNREDELRALQGTPSTRVGERKDADRIYWYQVYNDLSSGKTGNLVRPILGDSKELPYPRRLATNRGNESDGREKPPAKGEGMWLQLDDQFSADKTADFTGASLQGGVEAVFTAIRETSDILSSSPFLVVLSVLVGVIRQLLGKLVPGLEPPLENFEDFRDVLAIYKKITGKEFKSLLPTQLYASTAASNGNGASLTAAANTASVDDNEHKTTLSPFKTQDGAWDFSLSASAASQLGPVYGSSTGTPPTRGSSQAGDGGFLQRLWNFLTGNSPQINNLLYFPVPRVLYGRPDAWYTDLEFGRQTVAGFNPCIIKALTTLPESFGSAIRGEHVNDDLQGATLEQLVAEAKSGAKPRLFYLDYWDLSVAWKEVNESSKGMVQHAGRVILYLQKNAQGNDVGLIPVAIELAHPGTHKENPNLPLTAGVVYSRAQLSADPSTQPVWLLAKMIFRSLDSSFHQLISHWLRTHCVLEPFFIAMRRQISVMHPVFKLMLPHFRYTLNINRDARSSLVNAGGIIERTFSAGSYAMPLSSVVYGKYWNFVKEALPEDLKARGMVDPNGKPWLDYPYATDGLDMWSALSSYFDNYLRLYYRMDEDVLGDPELQEWWNEVKNEGHPDLVRYGLRSSEEELWGFDGPISTLEHLVRVLTTIAWLASGHHAAVNFGQYDYTSFVLNASSLVRKPMPAPGDDAWEKLTGARPGRAQEKIIMTYLADPITTVTVAATVRLLSDHARDEHTLDEVNEQLVDPGAQGANQVFIDAMKRLEQNIEMRNADAANWARFGLAIGDKTGPLPYTLLAPDSKAGVTMRGVPYSVSI